MKEEISVNASGFKHLPVLANEVVNAINSLPPQLIEEGLMIDTTIGGGGHSFLALEANPSFQLIGVDQDPNARKAAEEKLQKFKEKVTIIDANFADFSPPRKATVVLADLGVSSHQLDEPLRGFSFNKNGPIDMRMNPSSNPNASELLEQLEEKELADIIYSYGEEKLSRRIARRIKSDLQEKGPYSDTKALAYAIAGCYPPKRRYGRIHPATKTFQALRIAVNNELNVLDQLLAKSPDWLLPGGLLMIISFHSLEDRKVKQAFKNDIRLEQLTKKPLMGSPQEISQNPRSRSAKLRISKRKKQK